MKKIIYLLVAILFVVTNVKAQHEFDNWQFGNGIGNNLYFGTSGSPTVSTSPYLSTLEGTASISDPTTGSLLFYSDGNFVWDGANNLTAILGISTSSSAQAATIVPIPGTSNQYYLISMQDAPSARYGYRTLITVNPLGTITVGTKILFASFDCGEVVCVMPNNTGVNYWVIVAENGSPNFYSYLVNNSGFSTSPIISVTSQTNGFGSLKAHCSSGKIAKAQSRPGIASSYDVFDCNKTTGAVTFNHSFTNTSGSYFYPYGVEFSSNGNVLYGSSAKGDGLFQFDLIANIQTYSNNSFCIFNVYNNCGALQMAPNGKIYMAADENNSIHVINNPSIVGSGCNFVSNGQPIAGTSGLGLPAPVISAFNCSVNCSISTTSQFVYCSASPATLTASAGMSYYWTTPSATHPVTQNISATTSGVYIVDITDATGNVCTASIQLYDTIPIGGFNNNCTSPVYTAPSGFTSYLWTYPDNTTTATTQSINNTQNGIYVLTATDVNGCVATSTFNSIPFSISPVFAPTCNPAAPYTLCYTSSQVSPTVIYNWNFIGYGSYSSASPCFGGALTPTDNIIVSATSVTGCTVSSTAVLPTTPIDLIISTTPTSACGVYDLCASLTLPPSVAATITSYYWTIAGTPTNVGSTACISGISGLTYSLTVNLNTGCTLEKTITVPTSSGCIFITTSGSCLGNAIPQLCTNTCDGSTNIAWQDFFGNPVYSSMGCIYNPIMGSSYTAIATFNDGCVAGATFNTPTLNIPALNITQSSDPCTGILTLCDGYCSSYFGGGGMFSSNWSSTNPFSTSTSCDGCIDVTQTGTYSVNITDGCGNSASGSTVVTTIPPAAALTLTTIQPTCANPIGSIAANVTNATAYSYTWNDGSSSTSVTSTGGNYDVTVITDGTWCTLTVSATLIPATGCGGCVATSSTNNITKCSNELAFIWNGLSITAAGTYSKTGIINAAGCDSTATLIVIVNNATSSYTTITNCNSYTWVIDGNTYTTSGIKTHTTTNAAGCSHIDTLMLTINTATTSTTNKTICSNQLPYTWNSLVFSASGTQTATLVNSKGCDSLATLILTVKDTSFSITKDTVCNNTLPFIWNGINITVAGIYIKTGLINAAGCDSAVTLHITVKNRSASTTEDTVCSNTLPFVWNGMNITTGGIYTTYISTNAVGCDSLATLNLTVAPNPTLTINATVCADKLPYFYKGVTYSTAGTYTGIIGVNTTGGCDTLITLNLFVTPNPTLTFNKTVCKDKLPLYFYGDYYTEAGNYNFTTPDKTGLGCDTLVTFNLSVSKPTSSTQKDTICDNLLPYLWNGLSITTAGTYTKTGLINAAGCDSTAMLILTINHSTKTYTVDADCDAYYWEYTAAFYYSSGIYTHIGTNASGCPQFDTLVLTINHSSHSYTTQIACDSFVWKGHFYTSSGVYISNTTNATGCPQNDTLKLTINYSTTSTTTYTICSYLLPYIWNGITCTTAGTYIKNLTNSKGCDSTAKLILTVDYNCTLPCLCNRELVHLTNPSYTSSYVKNTLGGPLDFDSTTTKNCSTDLITDSLSCGKLYKFNASFTKPSNWSSNCPIAVTAVITQGATILASGAITSSATLNYTFANGGSYCIKYYLYVNGNLCDSCSLCFNVKCPCNCNQINFTSNPTISWNVPKSSGVATTKKSLSTACNTSLSTKLNCGTAYSFSIGSNVPASTNNCPVSVTAEISTNATKPATIATQSNVSATNPLNYTFSGADSYCITYKIILNGVVCKTCTMCFTVCCNNYSLPNISGTLVSCTIGSTNYLKADSVGGIWESSDTNIAKINAYSGGVNSISNGVTSIIYTVINKGCWYYKATDYTVASVPMPATITGASSVCVGSSTTLSNNTPIPTGGSGVWGTSSSSLISINGTTGVLIGKYQGTASIQYKITNSSGCSNAVNYTIIVKPIPNVPTVQYAAGTVNPQTGPGGTFCANKTFTVVGNPAAGIWSSTGVLTVGSATGIVNTGLVAGAGTLTYTINVNGCLNSKVVTGINVAICPSHRGVSTSDIISSSKDFTMYPNPATSVVNIYIDKLVGAGSIVVTDLYGKQVKTQALSMGNNGVDISSLTKGFYSISINTNDGKITKKLVVQ